MKAHRYFYVTLGGTDRQNWRTGARHEDMRTDNETVRNKHPHHSRMEIKFCMEGGHWESRKCGILFPTNRDTIICNEGYQSNVPRHV